MAPRGKKSLAPASAEALTFPPPGTPADTIINGSIDFTKAPWPMVLTHIANLKNVELRTNVVESGPASNNVLVETEQFSSWLPGWDHLVDYRKGNGVVLASRAQPCAEDCKRCINSTAKRFTLCCTLPGHFGDSCTNCISTDNKTKCCHFEKGISFAFFFLFSSSSCTDVKHTGTVAPKTPKKGSSNARSDEPSQQSQYSGATRTRGQTPVQVEDSGDEDAEEDGDSVLGQVDMETRSVVHSSGGSSTATRGDVLASPEYRKLAGKAKAAADRLVNSGTAVQVAEQAMKLAKLELSEAKEEMRENRDRAKDLVGRVQRQDERRQKR